MHLDALIHAIDQYAEAKKKLEESFVAPCSDWDCGLSIEFDTPIAIASQKEQLEKAKAALESALNSYIDARIEAVLGKQRGA